MSTLAKTNIVDDVYYPESDGKPMAENSIQYRWIVTIKENLDRLMKEAFVAADLFWYPVEGEPNIVQAPDVMVAIGRPKGERSSYRQWKEEGIAPQVVFEILSPSNTVSQMLHKYAFYQQHQVREYYIYDPIENELFGYVYRGQSLTSIEQMQGWISPNLKIRFEMADDGLSLYYPDDTKFISFQELFTEMEAEHQRAEAEHQRAEAEHQRAEAEHQRADEAERRAAQLADRLRVLGIDPDTV